MNIKYFRKKHGLTQKDLAKLINTSQPRISRWESGQCEIIATTKLLLFILSIYLENDSKDRWKEYLTLLKGTKNAKDKKD